MSSVERNSKSGKDKEQMEETVEQKTQRLKEARLAKEAEFQRTHKPLTKEEALKALDAIRKERKKLGLKY